MYRLKSKAPKMQTVTKNEESQTQNDSLRTSGDHAALFVPTHKEPQEVFVGKNWSNWFLRHFVFNGLKAQQFRHIKH